MIYTFLTILAQASGGGGGDIGIPFLDFINLGVVVVVVIAILRGDFVTGREHKAAMLEKDKVIDRALKDKDKAVADKEKAEASLSGYQEKVQGEILPQLWETTRVLVEVTELVEDRKL